MASNDRETQKVLTDGEELAMMAKSRGWGIAREMLVDKILDLQNIHNVDDTSIDKVLADIKARKLAAQILFEFKNAVEGKVEQYEANKDMMDDPRQEQGYIEIKP